MTLTDQVYTCSGNERFDSIARALWGSEKYAADLMGANPEYALKSVFTGGEVLYIPEVDLPQTGEEGLPVTAPWRNE